MEDNGRICTEVQKSSKESGYEGMLLIKEFKRGKNGVIWRKLIEVECPSRSIEQQYKRAINLDKHWKERKREEKRFRGRRKSDNLAPRINMLADAGEIQR